MEEKTPADSKIGGYGAIDGRRVVVVANDFTVLAATSSRIAGRKEGELKLTAAEKGFPVIYLGEAGGARMPDIMGSKGLASFGGGGHDTYLKIMSRVRRTPMITAIMGECYGMPTWMACLSDFVVQLKGSAMGVSGPRVLELALGESVTNEELGGWQVHSEITGSVDRVAETEDECFALISPASCARAAGQGGNCVLRQENFLSRIGCGIRPVCRLPVGSGREKRGSGRHFHGQLSAICHGPLRHSENRGHCLSMLSPVQEIRADP